MPDTHYGTKVLLTELPEMGGVEPSASLEETEGRLILRYTYPQGGRLVRGALEFEGVRSYRFSAESHCSEWQIGDAYDRLVEVKDSAWIEELNRGRIRDSRPPWPIQHYMIYIGDDGCYEIAAASWTILANG